MDRISRVYFFFSGIVWSLSKLKMKPEIFSYARNWKAAVRTVCHNLAVMPRKQPWIPSRLGSLRHGVHKYVVDESFTMTLVTTRVN